MEVAYTGILSGLAGNWRLTSTTYLWMFPIYGLAVLLEPLHDALRQWTWFWRGLVWVLAIWTIEASTGFLIQVLTGAIPWDYSGDSQWQVSGLIRLDMAPLWFGAGLLFEQIHDYLDEKIPLA